MAPEPSGMASVAISKQDRSHSAKELNEALNAFKALILTEQKQQSLSPTMEDAPRPRIFHKKKEGKREKLGTTVDSVLFELIKQRQQQGQQLSHILDSALWGYFGKPKLSFQLDSDKE